MTLDTPLWGESHYTYHTSLLGTLLSKMFLLHTLPPPILTLDFLTSALCLGHGGMRTLLIKFKEAILRSRGLLAPPKGIQACKHHSVKIG